MKEIENDGQLDSAHEAYLAKKDAEVRSTLRSLHVAPWLSGDSRLALDGNRISGHGAESVFLWRGDSRREGAPNARTKKADLSRYVEQDALDAAVALANIVEMVAPYAWEMGVQKADEWATPILLKSGVYYIEDESRECAYPAQKLQALPPHSDARVRLVKEVSSFVERFGLLHMSASDYPLKDSGWLYQRSVRFMPEDFPRSCEEFERRFGMEFEDFVCVEARELFKEAINAGSELSTYGQSAQKGLNSRVDESPCNARLFEIPKELIEEARKKAMLLFEADLSAQLVSTPSDLYYRRLGRFVKSYRSFSDFELLVEDETCQLKEVDFAIGKLEKRQFSYECGRDSGKHKQVVEALAEARLRRDSIHPSDFDLVKAAEDAVTRFSDKRDALESSGVWEVSIHSFYRCALLVHDAVEIMAALHGDEHAFRRLLPKFHMGLFSPEGDEGAFGRYTLWFESVGRDVDNPSSDMEGYSYEAEVDGIRMLLSWQHRGDTWFGGGWRYFSLCEEGEGPEQFELLVRAKLNYFLNELVNEGVSHNYKGRFASAAKLDPKHFLYEVNGRDHDLFATIWHALSFVSRGDVELRLSRCEACGRFVRLKKGGKGGKVRKTCGDACRQRLSRNAVDNGDLELKDRYRAYMESGEEVRVLGDIESRMMKAKREEALHHSNIARCLFSKLFG